MKIIAISGSLRAASSNTALIRVLVASAPPGVEIILYDGLASLPHFSPELEGTNLPEPVKDLRLLLEAADCVVICTPEYAFGIPGSLKNALDWLVSSGELWRKPVAVISASPSALGGEKAHAALTLTLSALEAEVVEPAFLQIPFVSTKLNAQKEVSDPATLTALQASLTALIAASHRP
ncbi:MAG: NADPH-dependent FMN reductase [Janthinobacterium lividum]